MASDLDRYGARLGRRFLPVRAIMCSERGTIDAAQSLAAYICREFFRSDHDLESLYDEGTRLVGESRAWLPGIQNPLLDRFRRQASRSLAACHIVDAFQDVLRDSSDLTSAIPRIAQRATEGTESRLHTQRDYTNDHEAQGAIAVIKSSVISELSALLRRRLVAKAPLPPASKRSTPLTVSAMLDLIVARRSDGR